MGGGRPTPSRAVLLVLAACLGSMTGCAGMYEATGTASQQDLVQVRSDLAQLHSSVQQMRGDLEAALGQIDRRARDQAETAKQIGALASRIDALSNDLSTLTSRSEELSGRVDAVRKLVARAAPPPAVPPVQAPGTQPRPATGPLQPEDLYQAAYIDFSKGSYALAITGFREFLRRFPDHKLADNAQYWIGESHLSLAHGYANAGQADRATQELEESVREFRKVITTYPRGDKVPTALYKEALTLLELKQPTVALARLQYLIDNFPRAEETPLARDRLAALKDKPE
jgi:tol-pal system protein YbgF